MEPRMIFDEIEVNTDVCGISYGDKTCFFCNSYPHYHLLLLKDVTGPAALNVYISCFNMLTYRRWPPTFDMLS